MTAVLRRLQSLITYTPEKIEEGTTTTDWGFHDYLTRQQSDFFRPLVRMHPILNLEYSVLCTKLAHDFLRQDKDKIKKNNENFIEELAAALVMAELLNHIYRHYLNVPREVERLEKEQEIYRSLLRQCGYQFPVQQKEKIILPSKSLTQEIRGKTAILNWPRLFTVRIRRVLTTLVPVAKGFEGYRDMIKTLDGFASPVLSYFAWVFYVPRFLVNVMLLLKHVIPNPWMEAKERELNWWLRLEAQLQRRWFELGNDSVWLVAGLLGCFVLTGALAPVGMYLTVSLYLYDVALAGIRAFIELGRLKSLQTEYAAMEKTLRSTGAPEAELAEVISYQQHLQKRMAFEQKRLLLSVINTSALFLGMCFAIPLFAFNPIIPFIGAALMVAITLATYLIGKWIEKQRPSDKITEEIGKTNMSEFLNHHGMFGTRSAGTPHSIPDGRPTTADARVRIPTSRSESDLTLFNETTNFGLL